MGIGEPGLGLDSDALGALLRGDRQRGFEMAPGPRWLVGGESAPAGRELEPLDVAAVHRETVGVFVGRRRIIGRGDQCRQAADRPRGLRRGDVHGAVERGDVRPVQHVRGIPGGQRVHDGLRGQRGHPGVPAIAERRARPLEQHRRLGLLPAHHREVPEHRVALGRGRRRLHGRGHVRRLVDVAGLDETVDALPAPPSRALGSGIQARGGEQGARGRVPVAVVGELGGAGGVAVGELLVLPGRQRRPMCE